jgi:hypothetical protein
VQKKILSLLLKTSLLFALSCANVPDFDACVEIHPAKGFCTRVISGKDQIIDEKNLYEGKTWFDIRPTMVLIPYQSYSKLKSYIIKSCKQSNRCKEISSWDRTLEQIDKNLENKFLPIDKD